MLMQLFNLVDDIVFLMVFCYYCSSISWCYYYYACFSQVLADVLTIVDDQTGAYSGDFFFWFKLMMKIGVADDCSDDS